MYALMSGTICDHICVLLLSYGNVGRWDAEDEEEDRIDEERRRAKEAEEMRIRQEQEEKERQEEEERLRVEEEARQVGTDWLPFHSHVIWRYNWTMCCWVVFIYRVIVVYSEIFFFTQSLSAIVCSLPPTSASQAAIAAKKAKRAAAKAAKNK
jgi:hypothetical protein